MQNEDRTLNDRAKKWAAAINRQFEAVPVTGAPPVIPASKSDTKMY
jgi:hypothetical protein